MPNSHNQSNLYSLFINDEEHAHKHQNEKKLGIATKRRIMQLMDNKIHKNNDILSTIKTENLQEPTRKQLINLKYYYNTSQNS